MSGYLFLMWLSLRLLTGHLNDEFVEEYKKKSLLSEIALELANKKV